MPNPETDQSSAVEAPRFEPDAGWVPADERLFGVDRRTIAPTLAVFALAIVMSVVLPVINAKVPYDDIVKAGDVAATPRRCDVRSGGRLGYHVRCPRW